MKTVVSYAVEMIGVQSLIFACGIVTVLLCHVLFGLSAEDAARNVFAAQLIAFGWVVRGWYEKIGASDEVSETR